MVFFNYSTMQMAAKVVYYGPGLCGKTTNLQYIYSHTSRDSRGEMVSLETETDRTLFFDLLPIDVGSIAGFATRIQLYTVPGQVFYNTTRKLVLKGVDGVVFVADSQRPMLQANIDSFRNLAENIQELGLSVDQMPLVLQYNKRDLHDICSVDELNQALNRGNWPHFESSALTGMGVFETLKGVSKLTLLSLKKRLSKDQPSRAQPMARPAATQVAAPAPAAAAPAPAAPPARPAASQSQHGQSQSQHGQAPPPQSQSQSQSQHGQQPVPVAPAASHAGAAAAAVAAPPAVAPPAARPSQPIAPPVRTTPAPARAKTQSDVLAELERIRKQAMSVRQPAAPAGAAAATAAAAAAAAAAGTNGKHEINREIQLSLKRSDFDRAKRFLLTLQVEDGQHHVMEAVKDFQVDIGSVAEHQKVVLRLNIALRTKE
jgi:signal recognition particle receptor subunit beta